MAGLSPMMEQYFQIKKEYADTLLFFRLGDFYEMFFDDAKIASKELELVLTGRDCGQEERAPMCGVPFHSADTYIAKLVSRGYKVAICEQVEDPAQAKGIVKRDVVRIVTPGTVIESSMLDEGKNNFLASVYITDKSCGAAFVDVSTGEVHLDSFNDASDATRLMNQLGCFDPSEVLLNKYASSIKEIVNFVKDRLSARYQVLSDDDYNETLCKNAVVSHIDENSEEFAEFNRNNALLLAFGSALNYLENAQKTKLENINEVEFFGADKFLNLDLTARRNLELTETQIRREKKGSLLWVLDHTKTAMGKRLIRNWVEQPLLNYSLISARQNAVEELTNNTILLDTEMSLLSDMYDLERIMTRIVYGTANAKELRTLSLTIDKLQGIKASLKDVKSKMLTEIYEEIDLLEDVNSLINSAIVDEPPLTVREGGMIRKGYNEELDSLHDIVENGKGYLTAVEQSEQEKTGIKKLKIGYNRVFGYYIEVTNSFKDLVPEHYIRKQTLANCERYITQELKELESKVLGAQERIVRIEFELFSEIRSKIANELERVRVTGKAVARLDVLCSLAYTAVTNNYVRPTVDTSDDVIIKDGRHPVVELMLGGAPFVPNDTHLDCGDYRSAIITGPNMAGKSTYMRQVALIVLMAQIGSFVPASSAKIGIVDKIFTRVGASDDLSQGQSTFMLEMTEVADILKNATAKSLIVFDEIGRGTSTFDGMSIARAVLEYTADKKKIGAKTLFATHYHELTELENSVDGVKNYNTSVKKRGDDITFLRRIVKGAADGSYGVEVAKLAGIPKVVVENAKVILKSLEEQQRVNLGVAPKVVTKEEPEEMQLSFSSSGKENFIEKVKNIDVNTLTPIEALTKLFELQKEAENI
ncbi:MAG: DNA mismatch repair protein MutS [Ruminococcaceae bacterium]|nr:DNA mismatch repair protein MutS [Oscillospiraceae bacterium]